MKADALALHAASQPPPSHSFVRTNRPSTVVHLRRTGFVTACLNPALCDAKVDGDPYYPTVGHRICRKCFRLWFKSVESKAAGRVA